MEAHRQEKEREPELNFKGTKISGTAISDQQRTK